MVSLEERSDDAITLDFLNVVAERERERERAVSICRSKAKADSRAKCVHLKHLLSCDMTLLFVRISEAIDVREREREKKA